MGDRTTVFLEVLQSQAKEAAKYFDVKANEINSNTFVFYGVDYGELNFLHHLKDQGIAYDSEWCSLSEYGPGTESLRFTPEGEPVIKKIYESYTKICAYELFTLLDQPEKLKNLIVSVHEPLTVLPWDNQEEYGKLYRIKRLIES